MTGRHVTLTTLALMLAKADGAGGSKVGFRPVQHEDGSVVHHYTMAHPTATPHEPLKPKQWMEGGWAPRELHEALEHPDTQKMLHHALSQGGHPGPGRHLDTEDLLHAAGVPHGGYWKIHGFSHSPTHLTFHVKGHAHLHDFSELHHSIHIHTGDGEDGPTAHVHNHLVVVSHGLTGQGQGTKHLLAQAKEGQRIGLRHISLEAARSPGMNGYHSWAALGFDGHLPPHARSKISAVHQEKTGKPLPDHVQTVQHLMHHPGGRELWKEHGDTFQGKLDIRPGSDAMKHLESYATQRGHVE